MEIDDYIKDIRKRCRMAMDGMISAKMRERGLDYKLNFGVSLMHLKTIAERYPANKDLAEKLWVEDVRELKILATMLYPVDQYSKETAEVWVAQIPNQEIREQICINLFQRLDFSTDLVVEWAKDRDANIRTTAYWLLVRLLLLKNDNTDTNLSSYPLIIEDVKSDNVSLRNAALLALKYLGRVSVDLSKTIMKQVEVYKSSPNLLEKEIFDSLKFEFEYYFED